MTQVKSQKFVLYLRISTAKSGGIESNGIHAQERDINLFLSSQYEPQIIGKFVEVESGANCDRTELNKALAMCRKNNAVLLAQKVDRVSRDVEFIAKLVKDKDITLRVANLPNADNFTIHLFAAISQQEREFISTRTKAAMAVAKSRGKKFGNPKLAELNRTRVRVANRFNATVAPIVVPLRERGMTFQEIANTLNQMEVKTSRGCQYSPMQVKRVIDRSD
jgi:DNA invertase Pin-like site-specific DNA recombinase